MRASKPRLNDGIIGLWTRVTDRLRIILRTLLHDSRAISSLKAVIDSDISPRVHRFSIFASPLPCNIACLQIVSRL